ncbi:MAG: hypothetical protein V4709_02880 [Pseudomonadota bacterium]
MSTPFIPPKLGNIEAPREEPFYFGPEGGESFAWLHPATGGKARDLGVVLCNPLGYDLMSAHRSYRYIATRLAAEGHAALRFEYPSTGDSAAYVDDPDRVAAWLGSIKDACGALKAATGISQVILFGLRSGGTLAAAAAASGIEGVVGYAGWSPFSSGGLMLREYRALASLNAHGDGNPSSLSRADGGLHIAGFGFNAQTVKDIEAIALTKLQRAPAARCLLMLRDDLPADARLEKHWTALGCEVRSIVVPGYGTMMRDAFESQLPLSAVETLVDWTKTFPATALASGAELADFPRQCLMRADDASPNPVLEQPVWFGQSEHLSGVVSRPTSGALRKTAMLFPTVGANHRIGSNRLHVELGRELAAMGYLCLRMDIDGTGDSGTVCERERFWEYKSDTYEDLLQGSRWLREQPGIENCVLWGICSGAYMAYHAAQADAAVTGAMLFNLQLFRWREDEAAENLARNRAKSFGFYRNEAMKLATWKRLLAGGINVSVILVGLNARIQKRLRARAALMWSQWLARGEAPARQVHRLSQRGCRVSFVCTPEDIGLHEIKSHLGANAVHVTRLPGVEYVEVGADTGADHTFTSLASQRWVKAWTCTQMQKHFP